MKAHLASYALAPSAASMNLSDSAGDDPPHQYTDTKLASLSRAIFNARRNARSVSQTLTLGHAPHRINSSAASHLPRSIAVAKGVSPWPSCAWTSAPTRDSARMIPWWPPSAAW